MLDTSSPPANPIGDFEDFFKMFGDNDQKYRKLIHDIYGQAEKSLNVLFEDILNYNPSLANYLRESPEKALKEMIDAFKNVIRIDAAGIFDPDDHYAVKIITENDSLMMSIPEISPKNISNLIGLKGELMGITNKFVEYQIMVFECNLCGNIMQIPQEGSKVQYPKECSNPNCQNTKDYKIRIEDSSGTSVRIAFILNTKKPFKLKIYDDDEHFPGDIVRVMGILTHEFLEERGKTMNQARNVIIVNSIQKIGINSCSQILSNDSRVYANEFGIYLDKITQNEGITETLFSWEKLEIQHRFKVPIGPVEESRYIGNLQIFGINHRFYNASIKDIKERLQKECAVSGRNINFCTMPLQNLINQQPDESDKVTNMLGFTKDGWRLPCNSIFLIQDHMGNEIYSNLVDVFSKKIDAKQTIADFKRFFDITGIAHKDQLFQWAIFSPFLYVFRDIGGIMPGLALQGPAQTGKSRFMESIIKCWFGHLKEVQNGDSIGSASRLESFIASSTLPIVIDDCTNSHEWIIDVLKSYLTLESNFLRKGAGDGGQFATINKPLCAPISITCNDGPSWFSDDAFLEREYLEVIDSCEQKEGWFETRDKLIRGSILQILFEYSRNWNKESLAKLVKTIDVPKAIKSDSRKKYIYIAFAMGKMILQDVFGIETKLDRVIEVLNRTRQTNIESLLGLLKYQIEEGRIIEKKIPNPMASENKTLDEWIITYSFRGSTWVKHPIGECNYSGGNFDMGEYWVFSINNLRDLQSQFEGNIDKKWTPTAFYVKIQKIFPKAILGRFWVSRLEGDKLISKLERGIAIPKRDFPLVDDPDTEK